MAPSMVRLLIAASPLRDICLLWDSRAGQPSVDNLYLRRVLIKPHSLPLYHATTVTVEMVLHVHWVEAPSCQSVQLKDEEVWG
jgi:hypothetical protein